MKAMILAAGLGTRLKPWTLTHPKALVPVKGVPMLERVVNALKKQDFAQITINIHHFGEQIMEFMNAHDLGVEWEISDERESLLDTGGGILKASEILMKDDKEPFLVHNVDILSNADLADVMSFHNKKENDITLLTSDRESSRKLIFSKEGFLKGWRNLSSGEWRPASFQREDGDEEKAFSGIYVMGERGVKALKEYARGIGRIKFPIIDFFLSKCKEIKIGDYSQRGLKLIDIGKPATLERANLEELVNIRCSE